MRAIIEEAATLAKTEMIGQAIQPKVCSMPNCAYCNKLFWDGRKQELFVSEDRRSVFHLSLDTALHVGAFSHFEF